MQVKPAEERADLLMSWYEGHTVPSLALRDEIVVQLRAHARQQVGAWLKLKLLTPATLAKAIVAASVEVYEEVTDGREADFVDADDVKVAEIVLAWLRALPVEPA